MRPRLPGKPRTIPMRGRRAGYWQSRWFWKVRNAGPPQGAAGWTGRRCVTGCIVATPKGGGGLSIRKAPGRPAYLADGRKDGPAGPVRRSPDPKQHGAVRRRPVDPKRGTENRFGAVMHGRTVGRTLARLGFRRLSVRPRHPKSDPERREASKKTWATVRDTPPPAAKGNPPEIPFRDGARVGRKATPTRIWARKGTRPRAPRDTGHTSARIFGAVCPERAETAAPVMPRANTGAMNAHPREISGTVATGAHAVIVCDRAGWHKSAKRLQPPDSVTSLPLPSYSPELNPLENVRDCPRKNRLATATWDSCDGIVEACRDAWNFFANDTASVKTVTNRQYAKTVNI